MPAPPPSLPTLPQVVDPRDKGLGAYYTESRVAEALCRWAWRSPRERLLDPSFGGGVFLEAAARVAAETGPVDLYGVEIDPGVRKRALGRLPCEDRKLIESDFFALAPSQLPRFDAIVGNPPFIRFQRLRREQRRRASERARQAGSEVGALAGSWVAFVAHASAFLRSGGRLAMVLPIELGHAPFARPLLRLLHDTFADVTFVTFESSLFPHVDQETLLLLADGRDRGPARFSSLHLPGPEALTSPLPRRGPCPVDASELIAGLTNLTLEQLGAEARSLYRSLTEGATVALGDLAAVASGYVTGGNEYFHLGPDEAAATGLPESVLVPALFRARGLAGLRFDEAEWGSAALQGSAGYLVQAAGAEGHPSVASFLARLSEAGVPGRYKARTRRPWYRIPRVRAPALILASSATTRPRLVLNLAGVAVSNTFHAVTPHETASSERLAGSWLTSLTALSCELEGHSLGGGLLKLDPGEARLVRLVPARPLRPGDLARLDELLRAGEEEAARDLADRRLLRGALALSASEVATLAGAAGKLARRRRCRRRRDQGG